MQIRMAIEEDEGGSQAVSLYRWLGNDPDVAGSGGISLLPSDRSTGHMGPVLDLVDAVLSNSVQLLALLVSVATWRDTRARTARVRIEHAGTTVTLDGVDPEAIQRVLRALDPPPSGEDEATDPGRPE
ncbi:MULTISPECIES: effector-associated constant component EACC1 [unclassified Streptomyces]|uniref:effector-associated constant component EACC1 n=1 Tax=unclassified Streptomyces TaxID=2593676 RepID=UPI002DDB2337|nr:MULTISPECIES: hypothetical protein [unclassified Streptomyces]WSC36123.1 hypothetical protein OHA08_11735 [Streptomyces sp. NBC_01763]